MGDMKAMGPAVSGIPLDVVALRAIESSELERFTPRFYDRAELGVEPFLTPKADVPKAKDASFTLPEVIEVWFESYTGAEPSLNFPDFIKGVACVAQAVEPTDIGLVKDAVRELATRVANGDGLPALDTEFGDPVRRGFEQILANGEPMSWRSLMAFLLGSYWLLGFIGEPAKKRGHTPRKFVEGYIEHYASLGFLPS
jgi:hypothetical protein